ncbi:MAG: quinoprotein dehydrogenase-associated putative ABC transporter substrate-binding protein [Candidatus Binataceae bacterium]
MRISAPLAPLLAAALGLGLFLAAPAAARASGDLRVCADPDYLPYSDRAGKGFENQVASYVAQALGDHLVYYWYTTRGPGGYSQFLTDTLYKKKCDVVMDIPYAADAVLTTRPYYISSYVFVFDKKKNYDITSLDSPALRNLKLGFEADTPVEDGLKLRSLIYHAVAFDTADAPGVSSAAILDAVKHGQIQVGLTWEPAIGAFLRDYPNLDIVSIPNSRALGSPEQYSFPMSMGVRNNDASLHNKLNYVIARDKTALTEILTRNGVKLYTPSVAVQ